MVMFSDSDFFFPIVIFCAVGRCLYIRIVVARFPIYSCGLVVIAILALTAGVFYYSRIVTTIVKRVISIGVPQQVWGSSRSCSEVGVKGHWRRCNW